MIADALVYAVTYINCRETDDDDCEQDDVGALESLAGLLEDCGEAEKDALAAAASRALAAELRSPSPRDAFVDDYSTWMEDIFGEDWTGNERS